MHSIASRTDPVSDTRRGASFSRAPAPRWAVNSSRRVGSKTAATTGRRSISSARQEQKIGRPWAKLTVPSRGSNTHRCRAGVRPVTFRSSSASTSWSENRSAMTARPIRSTSTSIAVTRSIAPFLRICRLPPRYSSCIAPARRTISTAVASHAEGYAMSNAAGSGEAGSLRRGTAPPPAEAGDSYRTGWAGGGAARRRCPGYDSAPKVFTITTSMPPSGARPIRTSSIRLRMKKMPRPLDFSRFSGASGSAISTGSKPSP